MCKQCSFCDKPLTEVESYYVCNECKTVALTGTAQNITSKIANYLRSTQDALLKRGKQLHEIDQKQLYGMVLTDYEKEIQRNLCEFADIRLGLSALMNGNASPYGENAQNLLYRLLSISNWLKKYLEEQS